jgi:glycosyltransferase involved in cell wall biosynthesis
VAADKIRIDRVENAVAVLFGRLGPYHAARLCAAARELPLVAIEFEADSGVYAWDRVNTGRSFERHTLISEGNVVDAPLRVLARRLFATLNQVRPAVIAIPGWDFRGSLLALAWALHTQTPTIMMSESQREDAHRRPLRELLKARIVRLCSSALVGGARHADYVHQLGLSENSIFTGYDVVDNAYFARGAAEARARAEQLRAELGLPSNYFLASNRFVPKKNLPGLLRAYAAYRATAGRVSAWKLVLLGDGPLGEEIRALRDALDLGADLVLPGFRQYQDLPAYYGLASAFVHASSTEQWGLVVNEAMASSLPVIVSERCGCVPELVFDGHNGFTFDPEAEGELVDAMVRMAREGSPRREMGQRSLEIVERWSPERFGQQLKLARDVALARRRQAPRALDWAILAALSAR